jgi:hypothetical protein
MNPFLGSVFTFCNFVGAIPSQLVQSIQLDNSFMELRLNPAMLFSVGLYQHLYWWF